MSEQNPYEQLGITEDASFDEIQEARDRLVKEYSSDLKVAEAIEAAYDAILMHRLRLRQEGKIKVPDRIRFPERSTQTELEAPKSPSSSLPSWLRNLIDTPSQNDVLWPTLIFLALGVISFWSSASTAGLQLLLAVGFGVCLYFLNRKEHKFGRSLLLTVIGLLGGLVLGTLLGNLLAGANVISEQVFEEVDTLTTLFVLWLMSCYLR